MNWELIDGRVVWLGLMVICAVVWLVDAIKRDRRDARRG